MDLVVAGAALTLLTSGLGALVWLAYKGDIRMVDGVCIGLFGVAWAALWGLGGWHGALAMAEWKLAEDPEAMAVLLEIRPPLWTIWLTDLVLIAVLVAVLVSLRHRNPKRNTRGKRD